MPAIIRPSMREMRAWRIAKAARAGTRRGKTSSFWVLLYAVSPWLKVSTNDVEPSTAKPFLARPMGPPFAFIIKSSSR
jgi:hypothetical protein